MAIANTATMILDANRFELLLLKLNIVLPSFHIPCSIGYELQLHTHSKEETMGFSIFIIVIIFSIWLNYEKGKSTRLSEQSEKNFWEREYQANSVRKKPIDQIHYITVSEKSLPFIKIHDEILDDCQKKLELLQTQKIANFTGKSNTDLKLEYGAANLPYLQSLDENYILLISTLRTYGLRLLELEMFSEARQVLEFAIEQGADSPAVYRALLDIYKSKQDTYGIEYLEFKAKQVTGLHRSALLELFEA